MPFVEYVCRKPAEVEQIRTVVRSVCGRQGLRPIKDFRGEPGEIYDLYSGRGWGHVSFHTNGKRLPSLWAEKEVIVQVNQLLPENITFRSVVNKK